MRSVNLLGVRVNRIGVAGLHEVISSAIRRAAKVQILNVNAHCLNLAHRHPWLRETLNGAEVVFADGTGVVLAARLLGMAGLPRVTYADWTWQLAAFAEREGYSLFLLGARPGVADEAAARLTDRHPRLRIAGTAHGYFDQSRGSPESRRVVAAVNRSGADILIVAFGMPLQEAWLTAHWEDLDIHVALTGGAVLDYVSGRLRRGPRWMTDHGLEWLARLLIDPRRLWRRYLLGNPAFLARVLAQVVMAGHAVNTLPASAERPDAGDAPIGVV